MNDIRERAANLLNAITLIKEANAMSGGAIGAGLGGLAGGAGKYLLGDKKKSGLRNFTEGAVGGAAVGGAVGAGLGHYTGGSGKNTEKGRNNDHPTKEELGIGSKEDELDDPDNWESTSSRPATKEKSEDRPAPWGRKERGRRGDIE